MNLFSWLLKNQPRPLDALRWCLRTANVPVKRAALQKPQSRVSSLTLVILFNVWFVWNTSQNHWVAEWKWIIEIRSLIEYWGACTCMCAHWGRQAQHPGRELWVWSSVFTLTCRSPDGCGEIFLWAWAQVRWADRADLHPRGADVTLTWGRLSDSVCTMSKETSGHLWPSVLQRPCGVTFSAHQLIFH